jgi:hypothetical protein
MLVGPREEKSVAAIEKLTGLPIERQVMEGLPEETPRPERTREARGRGPGRQRAESHGRLRHGRTEHAPRHETVSGATAEERVVVPPAPKPEAASRVTQKPPPPKSPGVRVPDARPAGHDASQLPAFLLRPIRLPPKPAKKLAVADSES